MERCVDCGTELSLSDLLSGTSKCTDCLLSSSHSYKRQRLDNDVESPPENSLVDEIPASLIEDLLDLEAHPPTTSAAEPSTSRPQAFKLCLFCGTTLNSNFRFLCEHCYSTGKPSMHFLL